jgi:hypothetical protein
MTNYLGNRISHRLAELALVEEISIRVGRRGRAQKFLKLTAKADAQIGRQNLGPGKGGFEHVYHQQRLAEHFIAQGFQVKIEAFNNGKAVDLELVKEAQTIAVEIAMSAQGEVDNFEKDFAAGWTQIWSVGRTSEIIAQVQQAWEAKKSAYPPGLVEFFLIYDPIFNSNDKSGKQQRKGGGR